MIKITFHNGVDVEIKEIAEATDFDLFGGSVDLSTSEGKKIFSCCSSRFIYLEVIDK